MYKNHVQTTLSQAISSGDTSIRIVKSVSPYQQPPTDGYMTITDSLSEPTKIEIVSYTALTDNGSYWTLTGVIRGLGGTTAKSHAVSSHAYQALFADDLGGDDPVVGNELSLIDRVDVDMSSPSFDNIWNRPSGVVMVRIIAQGGGGGGGSATTAGSSTTEAVGGLEVTLLGKNAANSLVFSTTIVDGGDGGKNAVDGNLYGLGGKGGECNPIETSSTSTHTHSLTVTHGGDGGQGIATNTAGLVGGSSHSIGAKSRNSGSSAKTEYSGGGGASGTVTGRAGGGGGGGGYLNWYFNIAFLDEINATQLFYHVVGSVDAGNPGVTAGGSRVSGLQGRKGHFSILSYGYV